MPHIHEQIDFTVSALIVCDGRVLLVHHRGLGVWLPPGGHVELAEDTDTALFREIAEETGLQPDDLELVGDQKPDVRGALIAPRWVNIHAIGDRGHRHIALMFVFRSRTDQVKLADGEHYAIRWFSESDLDDPNLPLVAETRWYANVALRTVS